MSKKYLLLFYLFTILSIIIQSYCNEVDVSGTPTNGINVVIFFSAIKPQHALLTKNSMEFLHFHEATRVKHNCMNEHETVTESKLEMIEENQTKHCKDLLKDSLMTLTHYCHTALKMKTAIASVTGTEITNDILEPSSQPRASSGPEEPGKNKRSSWNDESDVLFVNTNGDKQKTIVTGPKHTEVFRIRVRRSEGGEVPEERAGELPELHRHRDHRPKWDVLDVMKHVRYSFLGKMFDNQIENQLKQDQDDLVDIEKLGKEKQDAGLFETVKSTLETLQEPPIANFLMAVFGGHLDSIHNKHSPLVQSVKHVTERTDPENTLIILTGSCSEERQNNEIKEPHNQPHHCSIPVYAKGPKCQMLSECALLYDIPLTIRNILTPEHEKGAAEPQLMENTE
ncbi:uncharacterized protein LOC143199423 isoform X1 [Rhynchophorus ferrugineus]|uniref:uncharacterized protein LOC143199423 isoform X1 n=2 Tax=Rhynchophorus ferrugineus TaxID=354439 RepID=UPI003FCDDB33